MKSAADVGDVRQCVKVAEDPVAVDENDVGTGSIC